jgi:hypothetical protein
VVVAAKAGSDHQNKDDTWRAGSPPNLPLEGNRVTFLK